MDHRSKEGLTKARIIDAIIAGNDTREKIRAFLGEAITRKDLTYHLSKNYNGLQYENVLLERKGTITLSVGSLNTIFLSFS